METTQTIQPDRIQEAPAMTLVGYMESMPYKEMEKIPALWDRFIVHYDQLPQQVGDIAYGVIVNWDDFKGLEYTAAIEVSSEGNLPEGFKIHHVPAQKYAIFKHDGHVSEIGNTFTAIYQQWYPTSGLEHGEYPCAMERYGENFDPEANRGDIELWIPLK